MLLSVPAAAGVVSDAINLSGIARAASVGVNQRGGISLLANQGAVTLNGTADASSAIDGVEGGDISVISIAEVLQLLAFGHTNKDIADQLFISPDTVKTHLEHIFEKLGASDRTAAVAEALRRHLIE